MKEHKQEGDLLSNIATTQLKGVGAALAEKLQKLGISNVQDILFHLPLRYEDRTRITPLDKIKPSTKVVVQGKIEGANLTFGGRRRLNCVLSDSSGVLECRFFHFSALQKNQMIPGKTMRCFGEVKAGRRFFGMVHPEYRIFDLENQPQLPDRLTPVYPTTEGISQSRWSQLITQVLNWLNEQQVEEWLPQALLEAFNFPDLAFALKSLHAPECDLSLSSLESGHNLAQQRLVFEELLAHQIGMKRVRRRIQQQRSPSCNETGELQQQLIEQLSFELTGAQNRVISEIEKDLSESKPMLRLVQGDVGSGKTLVAAMAALAVIEAGYQVALMAPTEILAEQHAINFSQWFECLEISVGWLSGKHKGKARTKTEENIGSGKMQMVIGTHALFQKSVEFNKLGLVIIDEQHRFGVHQRLALREKGLSQDRVPHQLIMTATPIPRTLAMTAYADLDTSVIDELPPGRKPVQTVLVSDVRRNEVISRVMQGCKEGRQAYWVCTLIEESEALQCQAAEVAAELLTEQLQELKVGLIHGRMKADEKESLMSSFKSGELDVLVATTVIEVGVDVANASLMVIENPERLGLAQLHQLRGRVGRGSAESHCVLLYHAPLSLHGKQRLAVMRETSDGFKIAEKDLELRGPGEVLGTKQTGIAEFRIADLMRDQALIPQATQWAERIIENNPLAAKALVKRWLSDSEQYADV